MNATIEKFGYPATLLKEWDHWLLLLRPAQPTLGSCILAAKSDATAFGDLNPAAYAELATITKEIEAGALKHKTEYKIIVDRRGALYEGLSMIEENDILLIAGKGPERYQILKDGPIPFLDKDVLHDWCRLNGKEAH